MKKIILIIILMISSKLSFSQVPLTNIASGSGTMTGIPLMSPSYYPREFTMGSEDGKTVIHLYVDNKEYKDVIMNVFDENKKVILTVYRDGHVVNKNPNSIDETTKLFWKSFANYYNFFYKAGSKQ